SNGLFDTKAAGTGKTVTATVSKSGTDAGNYAANVSAQTTANVTPLAITGSFTAAGKIYDGNPSATVTGRSLTGVLAGDEVNLTGGTASFFNKNAGNSKTVTLAGATLAGAQAGNYSLSSVAPALATIEPKELTPAVTAAGKVYDGTVDATIVTRSVSGVVPGDEVELTGGTANFSDENVGTGKTVTVVSLGLSGADQSNYRLTSRAVTTKADITPLAITGSFTAAGKIYDGNTLTNATVRSLNGVLAGDQVFLTGGTANFSDKNVGNGKTVTLTGATLGGAQAGNYTLNSVAPALANITPRGLTPAITAAGKVYDGTTKVTLTSQTVSGLVSGDTDVKLVVGSANFASKNAGTDQTVIATDLSLTGADAGNYSLVNQGAATNADITKRDLLITATAQNKVYDGTANATVTLSDNRVAGDLLTLAFSSASFNSPGVGTGKTVTVTGITVTGIDANNYNFSTTASTTANITARTLVITAAAQNKVYDGSRTAQVTLSDNRVSGNVLTIAFSSALFDSKNAGTGKTVTVSGITVTGADAANYNLAATTASTTANITARTLVITATAQHKVYDGNATAQVSLTDNRVSGDVLTVNFTSAAFANKNVGTGKTVTVSGISLSGTDAGNYTVNATATATANITVRPLTVTATAQHKVYDGNATAQVSLTDNRVSGDALTVTFASATFADRNVGTGKTVTVSGITVTGADAGNYSLTAATVTATANINPLTITVTPVTPAGRQYSDPDPAFTYMFSPALVDGDAFSGSLSRVAGEAPGTYAITQGSLSLSSNYTLNFVNANPVKVLTITREDAEVTYTGALSVATSSTTSSTATVTLSATLRDITAATGNPLTDPNAGEILNARIRFVRIDNGAVVPITNTVASNGAITDATGWTTVGLVNANPTTGTMLVRTNVNIGTADAAQFTYRIEVAGFYQADEENFVVNVYKPLNDFITGGGHIIPTASAGTYASDAGRKTNFGFNVRYNKTGKNLQGNINTIFRRKEADGIVHVYQIKGNSMTSLSVNAGVATAKTAIFNGKANMTDITNPLMPVPLGGNLTLQVTMTDKGEPGVNDQIGITVYNNAGGIFHSSNWNGVKTAEMVLKGGNLVVNSGSMTFGTTTATGRQGAEAAAGTAEAPVAFTVNAYPNPFAEKFYLNIGSEVTGDVALTVVDGKGRTVTRQVAGATEQGTARTVEIDLSGEPHGVYFLNVQAGAKREVIKVFKNNR
ncbi:MAG: T9SS type A sorting domain-containing protein, partial [Cytophagales bacterium]|nr:T9SS type A sorting domain-containing protein [Cytophagales bacterium]